MQPAGIEALLKGIDPVIAALVVPAGFATKFLVSLLRATLLRRVQGNAVQTLAFGVATALVLGGAAATGVFADGVTGPECWNLLLVICVTAASAIGFHEVLSDRGPP